MYIVGIYRIFKVILLFLKLNNFDFLWEKNLYEFLFFIWICIFSKMVKLKKKLLKFYLSFW